MALFEPRFGGGVAGVLWQVTRRKCFDTRIG